jgi:hypothetical protein
MQRGRSQTSVADLVAAGYLASGQELRLRGRAELTARITADGRLDVQGKTYGSPSTAANAILGSNSNGWVTWKAQYGDEWLSLAALRELAGTVGSNSE